MSSKNSIYLNNYLTIGGSFSAHFVSLLDEINTSVALETPQQIWGGTSVRKSLVRNVKTKMVAKKKSKSNKLARMSEEEKLRYLQQRAAIEEEARRRKEQLISTFIKNKLKHEDAFSRLNSAKINQQWRQTLRQIKNNELHEAAETLHQTFDVAIQTKNKIIESLLEDLSNSVSMHNLAVQTHLESINKIISIEENRLETLHKSYKVDRANKLKEANAAADRCQRTYADDKKGIEVDMYWQNHYHDKNTERVEKLAEDFRNDYKYKALSETRREEEESANKIDLLQGELKETMKNHNKALSPFINHYRQLRDADKRDMEQHRIQMRTIQELQKKIRETERIKASASKLLQKSENDFNNVLSEKKNVFDKIRETVKEEQIRHTEAMKHLSSTSSQKIKHLQSFSSKLHGIISVNKSSQKYLNEREIYLSPHHQEWKDSEEKYEKGNEDLTRKFWKSYSEVITEIATLSAHHASLIDENTSLKHSLMKYMNTLAKPSSLRSCLFRDSMRC